MKGTKKTRFGTEVVNTANNGKQHPFRTAKMPPTCSLVNFCLASQKSARAVRLWMLLKNRREAIKTQKKAPVK